MAKPGRKSTPPIKSSAPKPKAKSAPAASKSVPKAKTAAKRPVASKVTTKPKVLAKAPVKAAAKALAKAPAKAQPKVQPNTVAKAHARPAAKPKGKIVVAPSRPAAPGPVRVVARPQAPPPPPKRSTYVDAVALYENGVQLLQARNYAEAATALKSVITLFPEEKERHERALIYIKICERSIASAPAKVESAEDRVYAATLAINNGALDQAIGILTAVLQKDPEHDHACYMLGVAHALRGSAELALQALARSMALNHENRDLAFKEPDLESLRRTDDMKALLAAPPAQLPRKDRPATPKPRR